MKTPLKPRKLSAEEEAEWVDDHYEHRFEHLIERFNQTGDQELLEEFILSGGDIHLYDLGEIIVDMMRSKPSKNPGGAKDGKNRRFYLEVEMIRKQHPPKNKNKHLPKDATLQERLQSLKKKTSLDDAILEVAERSGISFDGGEYRYKKGKALFKAKK